VIDTLENYAGRLPVVQRRKVIEWAIDNKKLLLDNFKRLNPGL
jgi:hypothetical protein